jgi:sialate O-acetylesterase
MWAVLALALLASPAIGEITLPAIFGDHMVLQQQTSAPIWGWGEPGEQIEISAQWLSQPVVCAADNDGRWTARLATPEAGGPYALTIQGSSAITLTDIMIGEVWICSGQSNMEMPVDHVGPGYLGVIDYEQELAAAMYPNLRLFTVQRAISTTPNEECVGQWRQCDPETAGAFSAVGYFFGRDIHEDLDVPVGMICSSWGGTPAQAWTNAEAMRTLPNWAEAMRDVEALRADPNAFEDDYHAAVDAWRESCRMIDKGLRNDWMKPETDDSDWETMNVPSAWRDEGLGDFDGVAWFRTNIEIPQEWAGLDLVVELGPIDDWDVTWFNGVKIGAHDAGNVWQVDRTYTIPADIAQAGMNTLTVRVIDTFAGGGIYGRPEQLMIHPAEGNDSRPPSPSPWPGSGATPSARRLMICHRAPPKGLSRAIPHIALQRDDRPACALRPARRDLVPGRIERQPADRLPHAVPRNDPLLARCVEARRFPVLLRADRPVRLHPARP